MPTPRSRRSSPPPQCPVARPLTPPRRSPLASSSTAVATWPRPSPPRRAVAAPHPQQAQRVHFGPPRPKGGPRGALEFLRHDLTPLPTDDLPLLRITYYWRVSDPRIARQARVWVLFTDAAGGYRQ